MRLGCFHMFVDGFGSMGDALTCVKCNYSKYLEALPSMFWYSVLGRVIKNDGTFANRLEFPFVIKFKEEVTFSTDWNNYTHYFDHDGKLVLREAA